MAGLYGDFTAKTVRQASLALTTSGWTPLATSHTTTDGDPDTSVPLGGRRQIRIQPKSNFGGAVALQYGAKKADGTFETPDSTGSSVKTATVMPGNTTWVEPVGDAVQVYGRLVKKAGFTDNSVRVIVTEYA